MDGAVCPLPTVRPTDDDVGGSHDAGENGGPGADANRSRRGCSPDRGRPGRWTRLREKEVAGEESSSEAPNSKHDYAKFRFHSIVTTQRRRSLAPGQRAPICKQSAVRASIAERRLGRPTSVSS